MVILSEDLFVNLIDVNLQQWITTASELDADATEVLKALLGSGPATSQNDLAEWTTEDFFLIGKSFFFIKEKITSQRIYLFDKIS